jgi:hypothetical protein
MTVVGDPVLAAPHTGVSLADVVADQTRLLSP